RVPIVRAKRPSMMEDDGLSIPGTPVLVVNFGAVLGDDGVHGSCSFAWADGGKVRSPLSLCERRRGQTGCESGGKRAQHDIATRRLCKGSKVIVHRCAPGVQACGRRGIVSHAPR